MACSFAALVKHVSCRIGTSLTAKVFVVVHTLYSELQSLHDFPCLKSKDELRMDVHCAAVLGAARSGIDGARLT